MYAISFDLKVNELKKYFDVRFYLGYEEIRKELESFGFEFTLNSMYTTTGNLTSVYKVINHLSKIDWFKTTVRKIYVFKLEDLSDFTDVIKET